MQYVVDTKETNLNVRLAPRLTAAIFRQLRKGDIVDVAERPMRGEWVELATGGFVFAEYLTPVDPKKAPPRVVRSTASRMPGFQSLWDNYPDGDLETVKEEIGGKVDAKWVNNSCTVRLSAAFNKSGHPIPKGFPGLDVLKGGDDQYYAYRVRQMRRYLVARYGEPGFKATGAEAHVPATGRRGVIMFDFTPGGEHDSTGHMDIWNGERCRRNAYFTDSREVWIWECN